MTTEEIRRDIALKGAIKLSINGVLPTREIVDTAKQFESYLGAESYSDETLIKVADGLKEAGLSPEKVTDAISAMQNRGILFRER